ncbi:hypothetical protein [Polaromonas sp. AET17H-212]|uniref:hypothetical protein n=1 Tax=Polaromonas sp. AET17H-212 TaxID=1977061 RepID=UPI0020D0ADE9|nr:hypothetical protein [Polaromonas sp. AET17H-212]
MSSGKMSWLAAGIMIVSMVALGVVWLVRNALKVAIWTASKVAKANALRKSNAEAVAARAPQSGANLTVPVEREFAPAAAVGAKTNQQEEFIAADRIVTIRLDPSVAVVHLRVYKSQGLVKREMIVTEPRLRGLLQGRRHTLTDAKYDPAMGLDDIKDETVSLVQDLINLKGNTKVKAFKPVPEPRPMPNAPAKPAPKAEVKVALAPAPQMATSAKREPKPLPPAKTFAPRVETGVTFEGLLIAAGTRVMSPQGRAPYETFEAKLRLANGVDLPLRGLELDRELQAMGVKIGENVAITPLGKVPVSLAGGEEGFKNMYRVVRTGEAH